MTEDLQKKYLEYQFLQRVINQMHQKKAIIQNQINEFSGLMENLDNIKKSKKDSSMYAAIGSGVFVKAELKETNNVLVNIGSNVVIERSNEDSKKLVDNQLKELSNLSKKIDKEIESSIERSNVLEKELSELNDKKTE